MSNLGKVTPSKLTDPAIAITEIVKNFGPPITLGKPDAKSLDQVMNAIFGRSLFRSGEKNVYSSSFGHRRFLSQFSLRIEPGTITALVGPSGSGKSVLLRLMSGIMPVNSGRLEIRGMVASLLELGENLELGMSIYENVELFGRMYKLGDEQIASLYEGVVAFSELSRFEDIPIRFFSTGMQMRVSIAILLMSTADILLIDDVLQVGDIGFQEKCMNRLCELRDEGRTVVIAVQDEIQFEGITDRLLRLNRGAIVSDENLDETRKSTSWDDPGDRYKWHLAPVEAKNDYVSVRSVNVNLVEHGEGADLRVCFACEILLPQEFWPLVDVRYKAVPLFRTLYYHEIHCDGPRSMEFSVDVPVSMFEAGTFFIDLGFHSVVDDDTHSLKTRGLLTLEVVTDASGKGAAHGALRPDLQWTLSTLEAAA